MNQRSSIAIIGSGPAALMAASSLVRAKKSAGNFDIHLFEKRSGFGRKLLIAGSSGLNITNSLPTAEFVTHYAGGKSEAWKKLLEDFGPKEWLAFIQNELGQETFLGTSDRYFVREMKASGLLRTWIGWLENRGVKTHTQKTLVDFGIEGGRPFVKFQSDPERYSFDHVIFALGGGSWEDQEPEWCALFREKGLAFSTFLPSNVGYEIDWPEGLVKEAEGLPLKKIRLKTSRGEKLGELVITKYGLEGTPIYFVGTPGKAELDLKPDLYADQILSKMQNVKENLSPIRRAKKTLNLSDAALALLFHLTSPEDKSSIETLAKRVRALPLTLLRPRPLSEAISSSGGLSFTELDDQFQLKKFPGFYACGEMLDWDAPTGGFLIQGAVSQGAHVAASLLIKLN